MTEPKDPRSDDADALALLGEASEDIVPNLTGGGDAGQGILKELLALNGRTRIMIAPRGQGIDGVVIGVRDSSVIVRHEGHGRFWVESEKQPLNGYRLDSYLRYNPIEKRLEAKEPDPSRTPPGSLPFRKSGLAVVLEHALKRLRELAGKPTG